MPTKGQIVQSIILARGLHLAGCWPSLLPREYRTIRRAIVDTLVPLLPQVGMDNRVSDGDVIAKLGVLQPIRLLTLLRVHVAIRVAHKAPRSVLALLFEVCGASRSWLSALEGDLTHLAQALCLREFAGKPLCDWFQFSEAIL